MAASPTSTPAQARQSERTATIDGLAIRCTRRGRLGAAADLPVLVLHGWGAHLEAVEPIVAGLEGVTEVLALDMPGFGESEEPPEAWDADDYAGFLLAFLDWAEVPRCHLIGHSHGGRVSICLASGTPERFERLILVDSAGIRPRRGFRYRRRVAVAKLGRLIGHLGPWGRGLQERMRARVASTDYLEASQEMRGTFRRLIAQDLSDRLPGVRQPTLLVWGSDDEETPLWMGERMEELLPDAGLVVFEGAGHYSYGDDPARFRAMARTFLHQQPRQVAAAESGR
jgi:pimeloyl-ACP methyl ester carboxylesterase